MPITKTTHARGFTLIEIILSIALIGIIGGLSLPFVQSFQSRNDLSIAAGSVAQAIRHGQIRARANDGDSQWGVHITSGRITLFKGTSFNTRDVAADRTISIAESISVSGTNEYVFNKLFGEPDSTGSTTLVGPTGASTTISINEKGTVNY